MNDVKVTSLVSKPPRIPVVVRDQASSSAPAGDPAGRIQVGQSSTSVKVAEGKEPDSEGVVRQQSTEEQTVALKEAITRLNEYVQSVQRDLQFNLDESSGKTVIKVLDRNTQEVIRQIPDELVLKLARNLHQDEPVNLFNAKA